MVQHVQSTGDRGSRQFPCEPVGLDSLSVEVKGAVTPLVTTPQPDPAGSEVGNVLRDRPILVDLLPESLIDRTRATVNGAESTTPRLGARRRDRERTSASLAVAFYAGTASQTGTHVVTPRAPSRMIATNAGDKGRATLGTVTRQRGTLRLHPGHLRVFAPECFQRSGATCCHHFTTLSYLVRRHVACFFGVSNEAITRLSGAT